MISLPTFQGTASSASDVPVLDLNFAGPNGFFATKGVTPTLTRGSVATYTDSAGVLRTTNSNIVLQSNVFTASPWTTNGTTVALTTATTSPDLSLNAFELKDTVTSGPHVFYQIPTGSVAGPYTLSLYVKKSGKRYIGVAYTGILQGTSIFDTELGIFTQTDAAHTVSVISASNGWYRFVITAQAASAGGAIGLTLFMTLTGTSAGIPSYIGDGTGIYIYGVQLEQASYAGPYSPTTTAATNNGPRIDYDPVTLACKGLLIEEARTNLFLQSNNFADAYWTKSGVTLANAPGIISPDGGTNSTLITVTAVNADGVSRLLSGPTGGTYSIYIKRNVGSYISIWTASDNSSACQFNISTNTIVSLGISNESASVTPINNGWVRLSVTRKVSAGSSNSCFFAFLNSSAAIGDNHYIYGAQVEQGAFLTSYIPTTTATVTRNTEYCSLTGTNFSSWFNNSEGTFVVNARVGVISPSYTTILVASDGGVLTNNIRFTHQSFLDADVWSGSSVIAQSPSISYSIDTLYKSAIAYKVNDFAFCLNNGNVSTDTAGALPIGVNQLVLASGYVANGGTTNTKITLSRIRYYNKRLPNLNLKKTTV